MFVILIVALVFVLLTMYISKKECKIELKKSKIDNRGVFAKKFIKKGEIIEEIPLLSNIPNNVIQNTILNDYVIGMSSKSNYSFLMLGYGSLYNHSNNPNAIMKYINEEKANMYAIKDIKVNEEILFNYGDDYLWKNEIK
jgi:SET domain-containing protein